MFDKTINIQRGEKLVPYEKTVIEKKAPTDESIKLYGEMRDKAYQSVIDEIVVNDNSLNIKAVVFRNDFERSIVCRYMFTLNSKGITGEVKESGAMEYDKVKLMQSVLQDASKRIADFLKPVVMESMRNG